MAYLLPTELLKKLCVTSNFLHELPICNNSLYRTVYFKNYLNVLESKDDGSGIKCKFRKGPHRRRHGSTSGRGSTDGGGGQGAAWREPVQRRGKYVS